MLDLSENLVSHYNDLKHIIERKIFLREAAEEFKVPVHLHAKKPSTNLNKQ